MLSYRHAFHAGNHADVLKHWVQVLILESLCRKQKPFFYLDTHSGAGVYALSSEAAQKTGEYEDGIARLWQQAVPESLQSYVDVVAALNKGNLRYYPGSPAVTRHFLREQDHALLCELHPRDAELLGKNMRAERRIRVIKEDGYHQLKAALPPPIKRGLVLIDPPYEIKDDYDKVVPAIEQGYKRFATGCFALWYPVVNRKTVDRMLDRFRKSSMENILWVELSVMADTEEHGMTASGMVVVNPPWQLDEKLKAELPWLCETLAQGEGANWRLEMLA